MAKLYGAPRLQAGRDRFIKGAWWRDDKTPYAPVKSHRRLPSTSAISPGHLLQTGLVLWGKEAEELEEEEEGKQEDL